MRFERDLVRTQKEGNPNSEISVHKKNNINHQH